LLAPETERLLVLEPQEKTANEDKANRAVVSGKKRRHRTVERIVNLRHVFVLNTLVFAYLNPAHGD
jgi:hypothetical protein